LDCFGIFDSSGVALAELCFVHADKNHIMNTNKPYLAELSTVRTTNTLHARWLEYALTITRDEALLIARNGLTHQARALRSMVNEALAGRKDVPGQIYVKLEALVQSSVESSMKL
jgi:vacuolar-type H+-ATPase subunit B/Vma2